MKTNFIYHIFSLTAAVLFLGCKSDSPSAVENTSEPINVEVAKVVANDEQNALVVSGTIEAVNSATLSTRIMGYVDQIHVKVGDEVSKGQLLISLNSSDLTAKRAQVKAGILEATAAFNNAKKDYDRFKSLFEKNSASQKELDDITARFNMAKARLQSAEEMKNEIDAQFAYTNIRAPFNGIVASKFIEIGALANPGMPLLLVESPNNFEVKAKIPESTIANIKTGMEVNISIASIGSSFKGQVKEISSSSALSGGQYIATLNLVNPSENIRSGMFASITFPQINTRDSMSSTSITIPREALIYNGQLTGIYTVSQQNTAVLRWLRIGNNIGSNVEVLSGLAPGEIYIVKSDEKLYNGANLNIQ
jgi:RND family efflux transporter MFP subunit